MKRDPIEAPDGDLPGRWNSLCVGCRSGPPLWQLLHETPGAPVDSARAATRRRTRAAEARGGMFDPPLLSFGRGSLSGRLVTELKDRESGGGSLVGG